jgi:DNA-binding SARP family transcriptional activator/tetratricopeptide (TPR) repeat protein
VLHLVTFGGLRIEGDPDQAVPHLRRSWLAVLAVVAAAGDHGVARDRLLAIFWPESDEEHARQSVRQVLYSLRQELGREILRSSGYRLSLDPAAITSDVADFRAALAKGDRPRAVVTGYAPFLDGFHLPGAPAFQRWADEERDRLTSLRTAALLSLATSASSGEHGDDAVDRWRQLTEADPLNGRYAVGYLKALAARGDRASALAFARRHEVVIRRELEVDPDPDVRRLEAELRAMVVPASQVSPAAANGHAELEARATEHPTPAAPAQSRSWHRAALRAVALTLAIAVLAVVLKRRDATARAEAETVFAVGLVIEVGLPDSVRIGRVLTDMLATSLARIQGLRVLSNSRLLQVLGSGADSAALYADAARRAGASDLLEGQLFARPEGLVLELRRVELQTGMVRDAFSVTALDRFRLVDSITAVMASRFRLSSPGAAVASATTSSPVAYRFYEEGLRAYYQEDHTSARRLMRAALQEDSMFAMAAYYEAQLAATGGDVTPDGRHAAIARRTALRLAQRVAERERLMITANILINDVNPAAAAFAESLVVRSPEDPTSYMTLGIIRQSQGNWAMAVSAFERAIALDSAASATGDPCRVCDHLSQLAQTYLWFDSLDAVVRTAQRHLRFRANAFNAVHTLAVAHARRGDSVAAYAALRTLVGDTPLDRSWRLNLDLHLERYASFEQGLPELLGSSSPRDIERARWYQLIALRNQGRFREAEHFHRTGRMEGARPLVVGGTPDEFNTAILAMARNDGRTAARVFEAMRPPDSLIWGPGHVSRHLAWFHTLAGMAWASAGDTARVRVLADSVEVWGSRSLFGRDPQLHHYLRGLLHVANGRDEDAVREFRQAIVSPSLGFTRVNFELGRALLRLHRPAEAIAAVQPALRGEIDASNLYITRTELHEVLADAFDRARRTDSAAVHYRAVVRAWEHADPEFQARRGRAEQRLAILERGPAPRRSTPARPSFPAGSAPDRQHRTRHDSNNSRRPET